MEGYAVFMGPKLFIVSPGVPAGWILHVKVYGIGNDEGGCRLSFVFDAVMERSEKRQKTSDLERGKMASKARGRIFNLATTDGPAHAAPHKSRRPTPSGVLKTNEQLDACEYNHKVT
ncbi:hypothetical protein OUZ56_003592 [Daphnia magna]|uniref:Uncharacterized protein n=1 Tax=Daphnia magna TaxID=35525 RepID=A0ABR0A997_9CRUS|nr:hypothetical protein OUZ56_003592 [Daphnia magna]